MPQLNARSIASRPARVSWAGVCLSALFLSGCSVMPPIPPLPRVPSPAQLAANDKVAAARSRSLERAVSGINATTVRAWLDRATAPKNASSTANSIAGGPREVRIDIDALARSHVAWQLADALQRDAIAPTTARQIAVKVPALSAGNARPNSTGDRAIPRLSELPTRAARSVTTSMSQRPALSASRATLDDFLADLRARQNDLEAAESELARMALEDRIRASTRGAVEAISLTPVSPETALELSNLRLQLLEQLRVPAAQKTAAAAKIEAIEKRLNEIWESQTAQQNARLRAAFEELPARLRREGLQALDEAAAKRESERYYARLELRGLIENRLNSAAPDVTSGASDTQILRLLLPPARIATTDLSVDANISSQTNASGVASAKARNDDNLRSVRETRALSQVGADQGKSVAQLRAQARRDARQWASKLALSWGARLSEKPAAPDRTALALQKLFGVAGV